MCHRLLEAEGATNKVPATRKKNKKPRQSPDTVDARAPVQPQLDFSDGDDDMKEQSDPEDPTAAVPSQDLFALDSDLETARLFNTGYRSTWADTEANQAAAIVASVRGRRTRSRSRSPSVER